MVQLLIVDDESLAIEGIKTAVDWEKLGVSSVFTAFNIRQAKEIFDNRIIDVMLCDIEMPQGSGLELLAWVREKYPRTECIFLTCHADFKYAQQAIQLGSLDYILKPVPSAELEAIITKAIAKINRESKLQQYSSYGQLWFRQIAGKGMENTNTAENSESVIERVKEYIALHIDRDLNREEIANHVYLNPDYLTRIFKKETGLSLMEFVSQERIKVAKELLAQTVLAVSAVAARVGYTNFSHFAKIFRKYTNMSPNDFKRKHASTSDSFNNS
jgi:YesN/AraC family two-component response regulator